MLRLKTNKTNLYKLVSGYEHLPRMRRTKFRKERGRPSYYLEWADGSGLRCSAFFSAVGGKPKLWITKKDLDGLVSSAIHTLDLEDVKGRGMVEEFAPATERRADDGLL